MKNIYAEIMYRFFESKDRTKVSRDYLLVQRYFHQLKNGIFVLLNGFVLDYSLKIDFAKNEDQFYLRRCVIIWSDLVKLNYQTAEKCPYLWNYMTEYTIQMSQVFDGFRLDNFHNCNMDAATYFIAKAKSINPHLFILSELFTNIPELDCYFVNQIGIHRVVREIQNFQNASDLVSFFNYYLGQIDRSVIYHPLLNDSIGKAISFPRKLATPMIYDQTHDNHTFSEKFHSGIQLPILCIENFMFLMIGTTRGFDQMFSHHIPVTSKKRYPKIGLPTTKQSPLIQSFLIKVELNNFENFNNDILMVEVYNSSDNWSNPLLMPKDEFGCFSVRLNFVNKSVDFKFRINQNYWMTANCYQITYDNNNNQNNTWSPRNDPIVHHDLVI